MDRIERTFELVIGVLSLGLGLTLSFILSNQLASATYQEVCLDLNRGGTTTEWRASGLTASWSDCVVWIQGSRVATLPPPDTGFATVVFVFILLAWLLGMNKVMQSMKASYGVDVDK